MQTRITTDGIVDIKEVTVHHQLYKPGEDKPVIEEEPVVRTKVFTDGKLVSESPIKEEPIVSYQFDDGNRLFRPVDTLKTKTLRFEGYSFIITWTLAREPFKINDSREMLTIVKDVKVYLRNIKDRNAQKAAKRVIKEIYRQNKEFNKEEQYLTLFQYTFGYNTQNMPIAFEKQTSDVYTVKETTR